MSRLYTWCICFERGVQIDEYFLTSTDATNDERDTVSVDGTMAYLVELDVNLEDASSLIPLEIVQAPALGEMSKDGFVKGWKVAGYACEIHS